MKTAFNILVVAILLTILPTPCFALWHVEIVSPERAEELALEIRSKVAGKFVAVDLEFKSKGKLKDFSEVELNLGQGDDLIVRAPLQEDRSKPGLITVKFTADVTQLDKLSLRVMVPFTDGGLGGTIYELPMQEFVQVKKNR